MADRVEVRGLFGEDLSLRENVRASAQRALPGNPDAINRDELDFYRTPERATIALLEAESFCGDVWEPACGDGAISDVLSARGFHVRSTDLVDRGVGQRLDFLTSAALGFTPVANVITNPPFRKAQTFAEQSLRVSTHKVALLCRTLWLEGQRRRGFFESTPLRRVLVFSRRVNVARQGDARWRDGDGGMVSFSWFVWEHGYEGRPEITWI